MSKVTACERGQTLTCKQDQQINEKIEEITKWAERYHELANYAIRTHVPFDQVIAKWVD